MLRHLLTKAPIPPVWLDVNAVVSKMMSDMTSVRDDLLFRMYSDSESFDDVYSIHFSHSVHV